MAIVKKYYKNSTLGYLVCHVYSTECRENSRYIVNGKEQKEESGKSILIGCVPIKKEKFERELKYIKKKNSANDDLA
jgi:hypothetical protein